MRIENNLQIIDERFPDDKIFWKGLPRLCYTLKTDDITKCERLPDYTTPYTDRAGEFVQEKDKWIERTTGAELSVERVKAGIKFSIVCENDELSEWGVDLPFNFMGKKNGGGWENQFLFNSPYITKDRKFKSFYLTKPNGGHLLVAILNDVDGWKMDYSSYVGGHYFYNLKLLANFDRAYGEFSKKNRLEFVVCPVKNYDAALKVLANLYGAPFLYAKKNAGKIGTRISLTAFGKFDKILEMSKAGTREITTFSRYNIEQEGEVELVPYYGETKGAGITIYGYTDLISLYKKSMDSVDLEVVAKTDGNLCEHQCWAAAMLRFLIHYKDQLNKTEIETYEKKVKSLLDRITETDETKAERRITILNRPYEEYPAYNIFRSRRIQEEFFGITILLDAYKYFKDEKYYEYAVNTMDSLLDNYQKSDGRLETSNGREKEDYTTVCCAMIPLVDMAKFIINTDIDRAYRYFDSAQCMAEYLAERGLNFPTEGEDTDEAEMEMEDGSISCTALALLYYCKNVERVDEYIAKAKEILDLHENWVIKSPVCQMHGSSLRWWETRWEGDADGPAICCGHAWTIWRAEADWLYYALTGDENYLLKAENGFNSNFSKIQENGDSYSIYNVDDINGGGFMEGKLRFKIANKFADTTDCGLSRYVWIRANDSILKEKL